MQDFLQRLMQSKTAVYMQISSRVSINQSINQSVNYLKVLEANRGATDCQIYTDLMALPCGNKARETTLHKAYQLER